MPAVKIQGVETPEDQKKDDQEKAVDQQPKEVILDGDSIPESFRGKPAKEVVDKLLETNLEVEKLKSQLEQERAAKQQAVSAKTVDQLSEEERRAQMEKEFFSDPINFQNKLFQERLKPLVTQFYQSQEQTQKEFARKRLEDFDEHEKEIDNVMKSVPSELKANPQAWDLAYNLVLGQKYRKQIKETKAKSGMLTEVGSAPKVPSAKPVLTDEEHNVAAKFGMTEEEWFNWKGSKDVFSKE